MTPTETLPAIAYSLAIERAAYLSIKHRIFWFIIPFDRKHRALANAYGKLAIRLSRHAKTLGHGARTRGL